MNYAVYTRHTSDDRREFMYVQMHPGGEGWCSVRRSLSGGEHIIKAFAARDLFRTAREYYKRPSLTRRNEVISAAYRWAEHDAEVQR